MAGVSSSLLLTNFILLIGLSEVYYSSYLSSNFISSPNLTLSKNTNYIFKTTTINFYLSVQLISLLTFKVNYGEILILSNILYLYILYLTSFILTIFIFLNNNKSISNNSSLPLIWLLVILNFTFLVTNLITLLLLLELLATIYYFFFLNTLEDTQSIVKLKNLLVNYLWLSFLTLIFYCISTMFIVKYIGTLDFYEINIFSTHLPNYVKLCLLISIFWKLGVSGFQFFKLELYQYLPISVIFIFSIFSIIINSYILFFLLINLKTFILVCNIELLIFIIFINTVVIIQGTNSLQFFQFIAISGLNTLTTIIIFTFI